jgi:hypothetical protein
MELLFIMQMSFFSPIITDNLQDFNEAVKNAVRNDFIVGPCNFIKDNHEILLLFDLPPEILVYINETIIPSAIFDYFNPLLINPESLKKINLIDKKTLNTVETFKCNNLYTKSLNFKLDNLIYYPPGYTIDYNNMTASRSSGGKQFSDILAKSIHIAPFHRYESFSFPGLPYNFEGVFTQLFNSLLNPTLSQNSLLNDTLSDLDEPYDGQTF